MVGTIVNAAMIAAGALLGGAGHGHFSGPMQSKLKGALGALVVVTGMLMVWRGVNGRFGHVLGQIGIALLALILGRLVGRLLRLQKLSNKLGEYARQRMAVAAPDAPRRFGDGFVTASILFCAAPLSALGALQEGLFGSWLLLGIKAVIDGLTAISFGQMFGRGVALSALPVVAWQGLITLAGAVLAQSWQTQHPALTDAVQVTGGFLALCIAVVILEVRKVELADYLPCLAVAPMLTWWWM